MGTWHHRALLGTAAVFGVGLPVLGAAATPAGAGWVVEHTPSPPHATGSFIASVSCSSARACTAVGSYQHGKKKAGAMILRWNGTRWTAQQAASPAGADRVILSGVSCPAVSECIAVGSAYTSNSRRSLAERWNGATWAIQPGPTLPGGTPGGLSSVSCGSAKSCAAVGDRLVNAGTRQQLLVEHWNGSGWAIQPAPEPAGAILTGLSGISCPAANACMAVGVADSAKTQGSLTERWDGTGWTVQPAPALAAGSLSVLNAVSCPSAHDCIAAGSYAVASGKPRTLVARWNGAKWAVGTSPNPAGSSGGELSAVSCSGTASCIVAGAVTTVNGSAIVGTLAERWNGTSWAIEPTPAAGLQGYAFAGVSCPAAAACLAVGGSGDATQGRPLAELRR